MIEAHVRLVGLGRVEAVDRFAFLHQVEAVACDEADIFRIVLEGFLRALIANEKLVFLFHFEFELLKADLLVAARGNLGQEMVRGNRPHNENNEDEKEPIEEIPDSLRRGGVWDVAVGRAHSTHLTAINGVVTQFFFDPQKLVVFRDAIRAAERAGLDLARVGCDRDVGDGIVLALA